jgi:hypothetical protein
LDGVVSLLADSSAPAAIGQCAGLSVTAPEVRADFLRRCLSIRGDLELKADSCIQGFLSSVMMLPTVS